MIELFTVFKEEGDVWQGGQDFAVGNAGQYAASDSEIHDGFVMFDSACEDHSSLGLNANTIDTGLYV